MNKRLILKQNPFGDGVKNSKEFYFENNKTTEDLVRNDNDEKIPVNSTAQSQSCSNSTNSCNHRDAEMKLIHLNESNKIISLVAETALWHGNINLFIHFSIFRFNTFYYIAFWTIRFLQLIKSSR